MKAFGSVSRAIVCGLAVGSLACGPTHDSTPSHVVDVPAHAIGAARTCDDGSLVHVASPEIATRGDQATAYWESPIGFVASRRKSDGAWEAPQAIGLGETLCAEADLGLDGASRAVAVGSGGRLEILAATFAPASGWGPATVLAEQTWPSPHVAVDSAGATVAAWWTRDYELRASRRAPGQEWSPPEDVASGVRSGFDIGADDSGNVIAVYADSRQVWARRYDPLGGWSAPQAISVTFQSNSRPRVVVAPDGDALAAWTYQVNAGQSLIGSSRYSVGSGWVDEHTVVPVDTLPDIGIDDAGATIMAWGRLDPDKGRAQILASRAAVGRGWESPQTLSADDGTRLLGPRVAVAPQGRAVAVWLESYANGPSRVWGTRLSPDGTWGAPVEIRSTTAARLGGISVGLDAAEQAIVLWSESNGPDGGQVWAATGRP